MPDSGAKTGTPAARRWGVWKTSDLRIAEQRLGAYRDGKEDTLPLPRHGRLAKRGWRSFAAGSLSAFVKVAGQSRLAANFRSDIPASHVIWAFPISAQQRCAPETTRGRERLRNPAAFAAGRGQRLGVQTEFKGDRPTSPRRDDLADELVAFANANGGVLLCGVTDDGRIQGMSPEQTAAVGGLLVEVCTDAVRPALRIDVHHRELDGRTFVFARCRGATLFTKPPGVRSSGSARASAAWTATNALQIGRRAAIYGSTSKSCRRRASRRRTNHS